MAYLDGEPLSARVARGPLPVVEAARLVRTLADAIDEAHRAGIVHRDLKPSNVLFNAKGQPVVTDFGLARQLNPTSIDSQSGQLLVGTPNYMAPEQVNGDPGSVGPATDIYALGVVLYELLTATRPFDGPLGSLLARITSEDAPPPSRLRPEVDARLSGICLRALAKRPADRFPSMAAFAAALDDWLATDPRPRADRRPARGVAVVAGALAILVVGGFLVWRPWNTPPPSNDPSAAPPVELTARDPAGARARSDRAWGLNDAGNVVAAIAECDAALRLDDRCVPALICRANAFIKKKDFGPAIADLTRATGIEPTNHMPEVDLSWAYNEMGNSEKAVEHANRAIERNPNSEEAFYQRGGARLHQRKFREAVADLTEAIRLKEDYADAYRERAMAHRELGDHASARKDDKTADQIEAVAAKK